MYNEICEIFSRIDGARKISGDNVMGKYYEGMLREKVDRRLIREDGISEEL